MRPARGNLISYQPEVGPRHPGAAAQPGPGAVKIQGKWPTPCTSSQARAVQWAPSAIGAHAHSSKWWDRLLPHSPGWSCREEYRPTITHLGHGRPQFPPARTVKPVPHVRGREGSTWAACSPAGWRAPHRTGCGAAVPVTAFPHARENSSGSVFWGSTTLASVHRPTVHARSEPSTCPRGRLGSPGHGAWCWSHSTRWVQTRLHYDAL